MLTGAAGAGGVGAAESAAVLAPGAHRQTQRQPVRWQQRQEADGGCLGGEAFEFCTFGIDSVTRIWGIWGNEQFMRGHVLQHAMAQSANIGSAKL